MSEGKQLNPKGVNLNLRDLRNLPEDKRKAIASAGGKASGEARKLKKTFSEIAKVVLDLNAPPKIADAIRKTFPELDVEDISNRVALLYSQLNKALKGDTRAFEVIRDTAGEKPDSRNIHKFEGVNIVVADEKTARLIDKI